MVQDTATFMAGGIDAGDTRAISSKTVGPLVGDKQAAGLSSFHNMELNLIVVNHFSQPFKTGFGL